MGALLQGFTRSLGSFYFFIYINYCILFNCTVCVNVCYSVRSAEVRGQMWELSVLSYHVSPED